MGKRLLTLIGFCLFPVFVNAQVIIPEDTTIDAEKYVYVYLVDVTDGSTPETGITITVGSGTECEISKNSGNFAACANGVDGAWDEVGNGIYTLLLDDADVTTSGSMLLKINDGGGAHRVFVKEIQVVPTYDGIAQAGAAGSITLASNDPAAADNTYNNNTRVELVGGTGVGQSRCITAFVASTDVATISPNWTTNPASGTKYILVGDAHCNIDEAQIQTEANDAIVANGLDHLLAASVAGADVTDNSIFAKLVSKSGTADWDDFVNTTDSLQAFRDSFHVDGNAELSGLPGTTPTFMEMIKLVYQGVKNKQTSTATQLKFYKLDETTVLGTSTLSDDGTTFTRGEMN